jgi:hypothetical protein
MQKFEYVGGDEAARAIAANVSPRYVRLEELESWVTGSQYDGRPDWWTGGPEEVPRWERKPCFVYPVAAVAISSNVDLVLGEGRFPTITSKPGEKEQDLELGLGESESDALDRFIREHHKISRFKAHVREAFAAAQGCGTVCAIHGHRFGKPFADLIPAKWGTPKFLNDRSVASLEIRYPYVDEQKINGKWTIKAKLYRRVINAESDITFLPADAREDGAEPEWIPDPNQTIEHGLGFCPVVWYPFMRGCSVVNRIDGHAIHENLRDEIQALDMALSQKQNCTLHSEPQPVETGVAPGYNPTGELGRTAVVESTENGGPLGTNTGAKTGAFFDGPLSKPARKKGPGYVWQYSSDKSKVEYLVFPSGLLKEQEEHCNDLLGKIEQGLAVVLPKPSEFKFAGAVSGRSLQETKSRQYDRCDQYRDDLEEGFILPSVNMQLRIASLAREQLRVAGIKEALPVLDRFAQDAVVPS